MLPDPAVATMPVTEALEALGVRYLIGGSLASSVHGSARATLDADIVAELEPRHAEPLVGALEGAFYIDAEAVRRAIERQSCFNLIHLETMFKVDVFTSRRQAFDESRFSRRTRHALSDDPAWEAFVSSAEDTLLVKLRWYRDGGEVSERQWRDAVGIVLIQGRALDRKYARHWADDLGVADLLARVLDEAGRQ